MKNETESIRNTNTFKRMQRCLTRSRICSLTPRLINLWMSQPRTSLEISLSNTTDHIIFLNYPIYTLHPCHSKLVKNSKGKLCGSRISFSPLLANHGSKSISRLDNESPDEKYSSVFIELTWATCLRSAPSVIWTTLPPFIEVRGFGAKHT